MRCGHLSKAGTTCPPLLSVDVVDRPCVPLGGPTLGAPTTEVQPGWGLPIQEQDAIGRHAIETAIVVDVCHDTFFISKVAGSASLTGEAKSCRTKTPHCVRPEK